MKDAIETLCSIDTRAAQIMDNAAASKKALAKEFDEQARIMSEKIRTQARARMEKLAKELDEANAREIDRLKASAKQNLAQLDENYKNNHDQYVREIFSRIIGA